MSTKGRIALVSLILILGIGLSALIMKFAPEAKTEAPKRIIPVVNAMDLKPEAVKVEVPTQGIVSALHESMLASEVAGRIVKMDPRFDVGGEFKAGEIMLEIESADYRAALANAKASAAEARLALALEDGRAKQAERNWKKLAKEGETATALVLRAPQLEAAQAKVTAAEEAVNKAQRDLDRCSVKAPFDCRVVAKRIGQGSFTGIGTMLADVESLGVYEVRLPVTLEDYSFLRVPNDGENSAMPEVKFWTDMAGEKREWTGKIVRTEGGVDRASRSVYLVAEVTVPEGEHDRYFQPGLFVKAKVEGVTLENVYRIPRRAVYDGDRLLMIDKENKVTFREVKVVRSESKHVLVADGLKEGETICLTPVAGVVDNMEVNILGEKPADEESAEEEQPESPANT